MGRWFRWRRDVSEARVSETDSKKACLSIDEALRQKGYRVGCAIVSRKDHEVQWLRHMDAEGRQWTERLTVENSPIPVHVVMLRGNWEMGPYLIKGQPYGDSSQQRVQCAWCHDLGVVYGQLPLNVLDPGILNCPTCGSLETVVYNDWKGSTTYYHVGTGNFVGGQKW